MVLKCSEKLMFFVLHQIIMQELQKEDSLTLPHLLCFPLTTCLSLHSIYAVVQGMESRLAGGKEWICY